MSQPTATTQQRVRFEEVTPAHEYAAFFSISIESLLAHLNLPIFAGYDDLDNLQLAFLTLESGQTVTLGQYLNSPQPGTSLYIDSAMQNLAQIIIDSCQELQISQPEILWLHPDFSGTIDYTKHPKITRPQPTEMSNANHEPIDCFNHALQIYPRQQFPEYWAMLQHNLGLAYFQRNQGDRQDNLEKSIECFNISLEIYTQQEFPAKWQINQDDLKQSIGSLQQIRDIPEAIDHPALSSETLKAFIIAIARQSHPFPTNLQAKIHELGQQIQANAQLLEQPIKLIRPLLATYPTLQLAYNQARVELEQNNSYRSKGGSIEVIKEATIAEITNSFKAICIAENSFAAAQKTLNPDTNLLQRIRQLWPKSHRVP
jgi:tetratricopeptide (TPR) repeat protein